MPLSIFKVGTFLLIAGKHLFCHFFAIPKIINTFAALIFKGKGVGHDRAARSNNIIPNANIEVLLLTVNILVV